MIKCDTCGKQTELVRRVVIRADYDRTLSRAVYNCEECYQKKMRSSSVMEPKAFTAC